MFLLPGIAALAVAILGLGLRLGNKQAGLAGRLG